MLLPIVLAVCAFGTLFLLYQAFSGPSPQKAVKRRVEMIKERHGDSPLAANAQAQIRKLFAQRAGGFEGFASTLIPRPALLRRRLEMTGKTVSLGKYGLISLGTAVAVATLLMFRGAPMLLGIFVGLFVGIGGPHLVVGYLIKKRVEKFTSSFPDAIELMVRGLRSGLPITETLGIVAAEIGGPVGIEFRTVSDGRWRPRFRRAPTASGRPSSNFSSLRSPFSGKPAATLRRRFPISRTCCASGHR
jgi:tight adherence protein B